MRPRWNSHTLALLLTVKGVFAQKQLPIDNRVGEGAEAGARAGAGNTVATVNFKQRSVGGT